MNREFVVTFGNNMCIECATFQIAIDVALDIFFANEGEGYVTILDWYNTRKRCY